MEPASSPGQSWASSDVMMLTLNDGRVRPWFRRHPRKGMERSHPMAAGWRTSHATPRASFRSTFARFLTTMAGQWQVSIEGGTQPAWARNGQELFYLAPDGTLSSVRVERGKTWAAGTPRKLLDRPYFVGTAGSLCGAKLRCVGGRPAIPDDQGNRSRPELLPRPRIVVVQNWLEELKRLVPAR